MARSLVKLLGWHHIFAQEIAANEPLFGNKEAARLAAYRAATGKDGAPANVRRLRNDPLIDAQVIKLRAAYAEFVCADLGAVVREQASIAYADITDYYNYDQNGKATIKDLSKLPRSMTSAIKRFKTDRDGNMLVELFDKGVALAAIQSYREQARDRSPGKPSRSDAPSVPAPSAQHTDWAGLVAGSAPTTH